MRLDINTPRGQQTLADEVAMAVMFEELHPNWRYVHTKKDTDAKIDAILITKDYKLQGIVLQSSRYGLTLETLRGRFNNQCVLTWMKVKRAAFQARLLRTPLYVFLYLVDERRLLIRKLHDGNNWATPIEVRFTETQANVNGGRVFRNNAYINMGEGAPIERKDAA